MFFVFWDFNQLYFEEPYGIIPPRVSSLCSRIGFAPMTLILISKTWWTARVFSRTLTILVVLLWTHSNLSFLKYAIWSNHNILGVHWKKWKYSRCSLKNAEYSRCLLKNAEMVANFFFFFFCVLNVRKLERLLESLLTYLVILSLLSVHGICGHFLGVESNLRGS